MQDKLDYEDFLATKVVAPLAQGFEPAGLPNPLFDWQKAIVARACRLGRSAIFAGCGLGKTYMQLAWADQVRRVTDRPVLILCPLAVGPQTVQEAARLGVPRVAVRANGGEAKEREISVTNYAKFLAGRFEPNDYGGVVLDESSILKSYMGKTKQALLEGFQGVRFRLCCSATPSPNDHTELGNHSQFLGVMDSNEMLSRWFIAEQHRVGTYRLKRHGEADFWRWVASWAVCLDRPSDLGYPDGDRVMPGITYHTHCVTSDPTAGAGAGFLFRAPAASATGIHKEKRLSAPARAALTADLVAASAEAWVVWCETDYEQQPVMAELAARGIRDVVEVKGSQSDAAKEKALSAFASGKARVLVSKPSICGFGLNWQHCRNAVFVGVSYSHEQFYQAVRRIWRFGQMRDVRIHALHGDGESAVLAALREKEAKGEEMRTSMIAASAAAAAAAGAEQRALTRAGEPVVVREGAWELWRGDCVDVLDRIPDGSVGLSVFSPPFAGLYIYSPHLEDMGNCGSDGEFLQHLAFVAPKLLRVTIPGRLCAVHCKDLPRYAGRDGIAGLKDFPGQLIDLFEKAGWSYHSRVTIWKCPVLERERTNNNGLLYKTLKRDSSQIRQGMADYLIVFRKFPNPEDGLLSAAPIAREEGLDRWVGETDPRDPGYVHPSKYARSASSDSSLALWQRYAEPVWFDIDQTDTLNAVVARDNADEKHICPLQLGLIRRCVYLWSNPGDVVLSPFAGIGSEGVVAVQEGRRFAGVELKQEYWERAIRSLRAATAQQLLPWEDGV